MQLKRTLVTFLGLILSVAGPVLAAGKGRMIGMVVDPAGRPISEVTVTATSKDLPDFNEVETTDKNGTFNMKFVGGDALYHFQLEKEGRRTFEKDLQFEPAGTRRFEFTMHSVDSSMEEADEERGDEIIETACFRARDVRHFVGVHDSYVYVQCHRNEHFLLTMKGVCFGLQGALKISISGRSERVCSDTRAVIIYEDMNNTPTACGIRRVEAVEGETDAEQLVELRTEVQPE